MTHLRWLKNMGWIFLACAALIAVIAVWSTILVTKYVNGPVFPSDVLDPTLQVQDKVFQMKDRNCQILIYGDSTALTGANPRVLAADTGLTACSIASSRPLVYGVGTLPVDEFLAHNPKPKFLVVQLGPDVFYTPKGWDNVSPLFPIAMLLRHRRNPSTYWTIAQHYSEAASTYWELLRDRLFPPNKAETAVKRQHFAETYSARIDDFYNDRSSMTFPQPSLVACPPATPPPTAKPYTSWPDTFRRKYEAQGIIVLIKASPIPDCETKIQQFQQQLAPLVDANVQPLPVGDFIEGGRHVTAEGAEAESHELAKLILARSNGAPAPPAK